MTAGEIPAVSQTTPAAKPAADAAVEAEAIARVSSLLQAALPLDEVLRQLLGALTEGLGVERAELYMVDERARVLVGSQIVQAGGDAAQNREIRGARIPITGYPDLLSAAVQAGETQFLEGVEEAGDPRWLPESMRRRVSCGSFAALPLMAWGQVVGVITLSDSRAGRPLRSRLPLLNAFGVQAGLAIERARLSDDRGRALRALTGLQAATAALQGSLPLSEVLHRILAGAVDGLLLDRATLFLYDEERHILRAEQEATRPGIDSPAPGAGLAGLEIPVLNPDELLAAAVLERRPFASGGTAAEAMLPIHPALGWLRDAGEFVVAPLLGQDRVLGLLVVSGFAESQPMRERLHLLMAYGAQAGLALERAMLVERLRISEQRCREFLERSPDGILESSKDGRILSCNEGMARIVGYSREELLLINAKDLYMEPEKRPALMRLLSDHGHFEGLEVALRRKDGSIAIVSATTRLREGPGGAVNECIVRDVTASHEAGRRMRLLSCITMQSPDAILSVDPQGRVTSWNRGAHRIFGWSADEMLGRPWLDLAPQDRRETWELLTAPPPPPLKSPATPPAAADGADSSAPRTADTLALTASGALLPVRLSVSALRGEPDEDAGWSVILRDLSDERRLAEQSERLKEELFRRNRLEGLIGSSRAMDEVRERVQRVARFASSVLVVGPSGTGKEVVANAIHYNSPRRDRPFVKVNCAALPEELLESELFGIERHVATGVDSRVGRFELADGGTLFLDEVGDMSLATQAKILRVLQEREFERVGGKKVIKVDVRVIAATNKDLQEEIRHRRFREDLYYRLNVIVITLPPLASRREDIDPLIDHFLARFSRDNGLPVKTIPLSVRALLNDYGWPGNVRELEHCVERAVVMSEGDEITEEDLPPSILIWRSSTAGRAAARGRLSEIMRAVERGAVQDALDRSGGVQSRAARLLGISERSMWYRVKKLGLGGRKS